MTLHELPRRPCARPRTTPTNPHKMSKLDIAALRRPADGVPTT